MYVDLDSLTMDEYVDVDSLTRDELIYNIRKIRNPMYQRARSMRDNPRYSQVGVKAYDKQMEWLSSRYNWFNPTGNMPKISSATDRQLRIVLDRLMYTDTLKTMNKVGARRYQIEGNYMFKGYNELTTDEQSALWRLNDRLDAKNPQVTSDEAIVLMRRKLDGAEVFFAKDNKGKLQVSSIVDKDGTVFNADPKKGEYDLYSMVDGLQASFKETIAWRRYIDKMKELRRERANKIAYEIERF